MKKYLFYPQEDNEELLGLEVSYLNVIGALMYLTNCTQPDIVFYVSLLVKFSSAPTRRYLNGVKNIFYYFRGIINMCLFYFKGSKSEIIGYVDVGYLSDPYEVDLKYEMYPLVMVKLYHVNLQSKYLLLLQIILKY